MAWIIPAFSRSRAQKSTRITAKNFAHRVQVSRGADHLQRSSSLVDVSARSSATRSVAGVLLLTEATMTEVREPKPETASPDPEAF